MNFLLPIKKLCQLLGLIDLHFQHLDCIESQLIFYQKYNQFLHLMKYCSGTPQDIKQLKHFFISRSDKDFWKIYDWFQNDFLQKEPVTSGLYDLNRYARKPWRSDDAN